MNNLPVDDQGELAFGGDDKLEDELGLAPEVKAVELGSGEIVQQFDGRFADIGHSVL